MTDHNADYAELSGLAGPAGLHVSMNADRPGCFAVYEIVGAGRRHLLADDVDALSARALIEDLISAD